MLVSGLAALAPLVLHRRSTWPRDGVVIEALRERLVIGGRAFAVSRIAGAWARDARTAVVILDDRTEIVLQVTTGTADELLVALG